MNENQQEPSTCAGKDCSVHVDRACHEVRAQHLRVSVAAPKAHVAVSLLLLPGDAKKMKNAM